MDDEELKKLRALLNKYLKSKKEAWARTDINMVLSLVKDDIGICNNKGFDMVDD